MRKIIEVDERSGLASLMGERVLLMCLNYFYAGRLAGVDKTCVLLEDCSIVYETGEWSADKWKAAQPLGRPVFVRLACIESFMPEAKGK